MVGSKQCAGKLQYTLLKKDEHEQHRQPIMPSWRACMHMKKALCMWVTVLCLGLFVRPLAVGRGSIPSAWSGFLDLIS